MWNIDGDSSISGVYYCAEWTNFLMHTSHGKAGPHLASSCRSAGSRCRKAVETSQVFDCNDPSLKKSYGLSLAIKPGIRSTSNEPTNQLSINSVNPINQPVPHLQTLGPVPVLHGTGQCEAFTSEPVNAMTPTRIISVHIDMDCNLQKRIETIISRIILPYFTHMFSFTQPFGLSGAAINAISQAPQRSRSIWYSSRLPNPRTRSRSSKA